ncbi:alpha/beta fold hydrolase [Alphaproteobacteria bacterium]|nr:alpha/beta fold hydrolase [Alphaproteobacteria bacterium]
MGFIRNDAAGLIPHFGAEALPWLGGDAQTLRHFIRRDAPTPPPNETVLLDLDDGDQLMAAYHLPNNGEMRGCLIGVHGLNGSMDAAHILWLTKAALDAGWAVLRVNMRGAGPARTLARKTYNAGAGADLLAFVDWARARHKGDRVVMMAHSLGGTAALNMALDFPDRSAALDGIITISTPLDMVVSSRQFHAPRNWPYIRYMLGGLRDIVATVPDIDPDLIEVAGQVKSIHEFDDKLTAPMAGYPNALGYYEGTSVHHRLTGLTLPGLVIHASNDPWIPAGPALDQPLPASNDKQAIRTGAAIVVTEGGGHVGFHDKARNWHIRAALEWINRLAPS